MSDLDLIETERLVLSGWRREQLDDLVRLHGDPEISRYFTASGAPWSREKCATRLDEWIAMFETRRLGIKINRSPRVVTVYDEGGPGDVRRAERQCVDVAEAWPQLAGRSADTRSDQRAKRWWIGQVIIQPAKAP